MQSFNGWILCGCLAYQTEPNVCFPLAGNCSLSATQDCVFGAIMIDLSNIACWKVCICVCHTSPLSRLILKVHCVEVIGSFFSSFFCFRRTGLKQVSFDCFMNESHLNVKESDLFVFCCL